jgi:exopolyphosphatase / guanosine-5'-triphosphate,3'-diphosphate pyrophosphatase
VRKAVVDVGSNSVLLLVAEWSDGGWQTVRETSEVTALGEDTARTGLLGEEGISSTLHALGRAFEEARRAGAHEVVAAATMAARIAGNADEFLGRAAEQGTPVLVLSGEDEANLGFRAVAGDPLFADRGRVSIVDPGGHSTELLTADRKGDYWEVRLRRSYSVGALGLRSELPARESLDSLTLLRTSTSIDDQIGLAYRPGECGDVVVLGATGTNLVSIREGLREWTPGRVHGAELDYEEISRAVGWLSAMTDAERAAVPGMEKGREKTLHLGALILERFLYALRAESCRVSVRGWRHALLEVEG